MSVTDKSPDRAMVIRQALDLFSAGLYVCRPGQIQSVDNATGLAKVKPLLKEMFIDDSNDTVVEPLPVVPGCVLFFPQGGDFVDTFPIKQGDACWLIFADRSLTLWQDNGDDTDPILVNRHDIMSGALCLVGGRPKKSAISEWDADRRVIGKQGGKRIALEDSKIHLGVDHQEAADQSFVLGDKYRQKEDTWFQDLSTQLGQAGSALQIASTALTTAASSNAVPYTGGAAASPSFTAAAQAIGQAASALSQVSSKLSSFTNGGPYLSDIVKGK